MPPIGGGMGRDCGSIAGDSEVPGIDQPKLHGRKDGKEEKELLEGSFRVITGRRAVHDPVYDICCKEGTIILYKLAIIPDDFVRLLGIPAVRKEAGAGINIPGGQPETIHEIVVGSKGRQMVRGSNSLINGTESLCKSQVITLTLSNYYKKSHNTPFCAKLVPKGG